MLKKRIIPTLLYKSPGLVKGVGFDSWRRVGTVLPAVKVYSRRDVDEMVLLGIMATREGREPDYEMIKDVADACFVPLSVGGGINEISHIRELLRCGADKVVLNSVTFKNPNFIKEASLEFGAQCIVVSIDARLGQDGEYVCYSHSGTQVENVRVADWVSRLEDLGAGEVMVTSIEKDGTMTGYDLDLIKLIAKHTRLPVIASGGAGKVQDFVDVLKIEGVQAAAAASVFHFTEMTPLDAKQALASNGIPVRK